MLFQIKKREKIRLKFAIFQIVNQEKRQEKEFKIAQPIS